MPPVTTLARTSLVMLTPSSLTVSGYLLESPLSNWIRFSLSVLYPHRKEILREIGGSGARPAIESGPRSVGENNLAGDPSDFQADGGLEVSAVDQAADGCGEEASLLLGTGQKQGGHLNAVEREASLDPIAAEGRKDRSDGRPCELFAATP